MIRTGRLAMRFLVVVSLAAAACLLGVDAARADTLSFVAVKDNTLFEDPDGALSGGQAPRLFAGRTNQVDNNVRRALLAFDFSALPTGAVIQSVSLRLTLVQVVNANPWSFGLHRVLADWGEGNSVGGGMGGGGGAPSQTGDATWLHRFYTTQLWTNPGGDFVATASTETSVGDLAQPGNLPRDYNWSSTAAAVADVQSWVDNPSANFGWLLRGNENQAQTAKGFASSEALDAATRPTLFVNFVVLPEPGTLPLAALGMGMLLPVALLRRRKRVPRNG